jgi:gamma-glutamyltranspeptidase / glutathione hydrolase
MSAIERLREIAAVGGRRVVTSSHQAATAAGAAAFAAGGNAFDAALAACFMEGVALPMKCGLGGDVVALFRRSDGPFMVLTSIGPGPLALNSGEALERLGPRSVGVPGAPDGYATLHGFACLTLEQLGAPAVAAAEIGIPWTRVALNYLIQAEPLLARWSPQSPYSPDGVRPRIGEVRRLPGLAKLLRQFVCDGARLFAGAAGDQYIKELQSLGGILTKADLMTRPAQVALAETRPLRNGMTLTVTPAPTSGPRLVTLVTRALEGNEPLLSLVRTEREQAKTSGRQTEDGGTSVVTAADDEGNAVVVVHSNSFPQFGSGIVLSNGLVLNNRPGRGFDLAAPVNAWNAPRAGRVPQTTLHAWALDRGPDLLIGATPGGVNQLTWNVQCILELIEGASPAEAVTNPRWALNESNELTAEPAARLPENSVFKRVSPVSQGSAQQILQFMPEALLGAAADPRSGACALAVY